MPSTGREIAAQLDETGFKESDLLKPKVSLRFGAHYLKSQLDLFGGNIAATLAAYNGGPGNASRWQTAAGDDPDVFLEAIDFPETHTYVRTVLENYALYRYAYGVTDHPSLPLE
jgi:soluble lytic murein transglycosylase